VKTRWIKPRIAWNARSGPLKIHDTTFSWSEATERVVPDPEMGRPRRRLVVAGRAIRSMRAMSGT